MRRRIRAASYFVIVVFAVFTLKLFYLQIIRGEEYKRASDNNRLKIVNMASSRGIIYDRNGTPLVRNIPSFDISVIRDDLPDDPDTLSSLSSLLDIDHELMIRKLAGRSVRTFEPLLLKENLSLEEVARIEARKIDFPGIRLDVRTDREYLYGEHAAHVIGYLSQLTVEQLREGGYPDLPEKAFAGQYGVEKAYDRSLRGETGREIIEVDAIGRETRVVSIDHPLRGQDIRLTIDIQVQMEAERSLKGRRGAIVAVVPDTGEILALASSPAFDPNLFTGGISADDWKRLTTDPDRPLLNRSIQSRYPPGSTFKVVTALAALEEGIITSRTEFDCKGFIEVGGREFSCWKKDGHGKVNLHRALAESCDVFFYEIARRIDIDILAEYAEMFGLGKPTGLEMGGEVSGLVPTSEWKRSVKNERWYLGETLNTVIGQGYLTATPIQMAMLTAALVNGGKLVRPSILLNETESSDMDEGVVNISKKNLELIKRALVGSVMDEKGSGRKARSDITVIGGKTGTAQVVSSDAFTEDSPEEFRDHAWFIAFAPEEQPEIAVSVLVEHGGYGGAAAAPVAKNVIEAYFKNRDQ
jgi:penicillin-binding protein 2